MNQTTRRTSNSVVTALALGLLLASSTHAADYYEEPSAAAPHAKLAYMAERTHVLVLAIDGDAVFGDKQRQRLMSLEGASSDKYLRVTPGTHELRLRVFYQEFGGAREMSDVSAVDVQFQASRMYYPLTEKTPLENGKVKAVFSVADAKSESDLNLVIAERLPQAGEGDAALSTKMLPKYSAELVGRNEVRITNPNEFAVLAGIRSGKRGANLTVPANGQCSAYVPDGRYDIFFVYSSKPNALFQGDSFTLNGNGIEIKIVKVVGGNYGIRQVK